MRWASDRRMLPPDGMRMKRNIKTDELLSAIDERILGRQEGIARLNYHVARRRAALEGWWRPAGTGGALLIAGVFLMVLGWYTLRRAVNARWNLPPLDERYRTHG